MAPVANINPQLENLKEDFLYHLALGTKDNLQEMFGDVKFVCTGGTPNRMKYFAEYIAKEIGFKIPTGTQIKDISESANRYAMYKVGPVLSVSHGMGVPSMGILTHELIKLVHYAKCQNPVFFRIGTCGGLGIEGGTVIVSEDCCNGMCEKVFSLPILGRPVARPSLLDKCLVEELKTIGSQSGGFKVVSGTTMCTDDFYEGQGRLDGAFCEFSESDKLCYLKGIKDRGIVNMEMEATSFAALTHHAKIKAGIVCVALVNRLNGDQITTPKETLTEWQERPCKLVGEYIKKNLQSC